jgi:hypothetical protein
MRHTARTTSSSLEPQHAPRVRTKVLGWGQVYLVRATLPPAQHVLDHLHRQHVTPRGAVEGGQCQHAPCQSINTLT